MLNNNKELVPILRDNCVDKTISLASTIPAMLNEGFVLSQNFASKLALVSLLIDCFDNTILFDCEQKEGLNQLYNQVISL